MESKELKERFLRLPREQQIALARISLSRTMPEIEEYFKLKKMLDDNFNALITILANIKKFSDDAESVIIARYKELKNDKELKNEVKVDE